MMVELAPGHKRGLSLANPVMNASGVLGFAGENRGLIDFAGLGAFVTNALTATPRTAAHPPNAIQLPNGVLIHTGLPNPGVNAALRRYAREWQRLGPPIIVHLAATTPGEVRRSVAQIERVEAVSGIELGLRDGVLRDEAVTLVRAALSGLPLIVRLPILSACELCEAIVRSGADALTVGAPPRGLALLPNGKGSTGEGESAKVTGRLYSPDNFPDALEAVRQVVEATRETPLPIIGAGGIYAVENALAMLAAGAAAVQVDGVAWREPQIFSRLVLTLG
jgi:dihydroorotate dehydrogenase (NAD+) catalytic subunit